MSIDLPSSKIFIFLITGFLLAAKNIHAADIEVLKQQCVEIGFQIKTPDNGKCVLKMLKKATSSSESNLSSPVATSQTVEAAQQRTYERQQSYARDAERAERERVRQQQLEMLALQRRSVEAQESAAQAQRSANYQNIIQSFTPRTPVTCLRNGDFTTCR